MFDCKHSTTDYRWKHDGVRVTKGDQLDANTPQTPRMFRQTAINHARRRSEDLGRAVSITLDAKTGVHHHGRTLVRHLRPKGS